ncbi:MAG: hypothetical protein ACYCOX_01535 [Acidobacteriaceae bacterium]
MVGVERIPEVETDSFVEMVVAPEPGVRIICRFVPDGQKRSEMFGKEHFPSVTGIRLEGKPRKKKGPLPERLVGQNRTGHPRICPEQFLSHLLEILLVFAPVGDRKIDGKRRAPIAAIFKRRFQKRFLLFFLVFQTIRPSRKEKGQEPVDRHLALNPMKRFFPWGFPEIHDQIVAEIRFFQKGSQYIPVDLQWPCPQSMETAMEKRSVRMIGDKTFGPFRKRRRGQLLRKRGCGLS